MSKKPEAKPLRLCRLTLAVSKKPATISRDNVLVYVFEYGWVSKRLRNSRQFSCDEERQCLNSCLYRYHPMPSADVGSWSNLGVARLEALLCVPEAFRCQVHRSFPVTVVACVEALLYSEAIRAPVQKCLTACLVGTFRCQVRTLVLGQT